MAPDWSIGEQTGDLFFYSFFFPLVELKWGVFWKVETITFLVFHLVVLRSIYFCFLWGLFRGIFDRLIFRQNYWIQELALHVQNTYSMDRNGR